MNADCGTAPSMVSLYQLADGMSIQYSKAKPQISDGGQVGRPSRPQTPFCYFLTYAFTHLPQTKMTNSIM